MAPSGGVEDEEACSGQNQQTSGAARRPALIHHFFPSSGRSEGKKERKKDHARWIFSPFSSPEIRRVWGGSSSFVAGVPSRQCYGEYFFSFPLPLPPFAVTVDEGCSNVIWSSLPLACLCSRFRTNSLEGKSMNTSIIWVI